MSNEHPCGLLMDGTVRRHHKYSFINKKSQITPLHRGLQRHYSAHTGLLWQKKKEDTSHTWVRSRVAAYVEEKMRTNVNHVPWFCTMNQVPLVTRSSVVLYTPTQAHSCKSGLLKDDCTPASILEFKSTTHSLWLLTSRVKSTELAQNPTRQTTS